MQRAGGWQGIVKNGDETRLHVGKGLASPDTNYLGVDAAGGSGKERQMDRPVA